MSRKILLLSKPEVLALLRGHSITRDGVHIIPDDDLCDLAAEVNNLVAMPDPRTWVPREVRPTRVPLCGKCKSQKTKQFPVGSVAHNLGAVQVVGCKQDDRIHDAHDAQAMCPLLHQPVGDMNLGAIPPEGTCQHGVPPGKPCKDCIVTKPVNKAKSTP